MEVSVTDAKGKLTELVRRALSGDDVVLTRHGQAVARIVPVNKRPSLESKMSLIEDLRRSAAAKLAPGPSAARSQDFLYGEDGLPK